MQIDPTTESGDASKKSRRPASPITIALLTLLWLAVLFLRNDFWNWETPRPLLFGFLPVGLWWQALVSLAASLTLALFVRFAWPYHLEDESAAPTSGGDADANTPDKKT